MPVPATLADLSTTIGSNSPAGTESAKGTVDDYLRAHAGFIAQLAAIVAGATTTLASGATVAIGAAPSVNVAITGTTTITAFDTVAEGTLRWVVFTGVLTLTHNAGSLILPGAANITTAAGDAALFKSLGGGNWRCLSYQLSGAQIAAMLAGKSIPGSIAATGQVLLKDGATGSPGLAWSSDTNTGLIRSGPGSIGIVCGGVVVGTLTSTGLSVIKVTQTAP